MRILSVLGTKFLMLSITILYGAIVFFGAVFLAGVQLRSKAGEGFDTWKLSYDAVQGQENRLKSMQDKQKSDQEELDSYKYCLQFFDNNGNLKADIDEKTRQEVAKAKQEGKSPQDISGLSGDTACIVLRSAGVQSYIAYSDRQVKQDSAEIDDLQKSLPALRNQRDEEAKGHGDFVALTILEGENRFWRPFIDNPYDLVVLVLVMTMGAIGGIMRIFRDYFHPHHPNPGPKDYGLIPSIGAVVAIGGYVLAKTGLLLLSSSGGETSLSPYMVSFVGILSGLLAKEVIEAIAAAGREILQRNAQGEQQGSGRTKVKSQAPAPEKSSSDHEAAAA